MNLTKTSPELSAMMPREIKSLFDSISAKGMDIDDDENTTLHRIWIELEARRDEESRKVLKMVQDDVAGWVEGEE